MSYILDALRKSERERTLARGVGFSDAGRRLSDSAHGVLWFVAGAFALVAVVIVAVFAFHHFAGAPAPVTAASVPVATNVTPQDSFTSSPAAPMPLAPATGEASLLSALSPEFQGAVPEMTVNIHVYAPDEAQRILYINNRQVRRGQEVTGGVVVEDIVVDGVVLQFRGQRFKLPRPS